MRVNIEEECFSRLSRFVDLMGIDAREALGTLAFLWHDSQDMLQAEGTFEEIVDWCRITKLPEAEQSRWIKTLCRARFLTEKDNGRFLIHGNEAQIDAKVQYIERAKKGGAATKKSWELKKQGLKQASGRLQAGFKPATSTPQAGLEQASGRLEQGFKQAQSNAMQSKANQEKNTSAPSKLGAEVYPDDFIPVASDLALREVPAQVVIKWKDLYDTQWIIHQIKEALIWEMLNPQKKKKHFDRFMSGWLSRNWKEKKEREAKQPHQPQVSGTVLLDLFKRD